MVSLGNLTSPLGELSLAQRLDLTLGPRHRSHYYAVAITILYAAIFLTSLLGNLSTCIVIARRRYMRTATNCYLFSLAISDMVTILIGMPPEFWTVWEQYPWPFGDAYCVMKCFLSEITSYASVLTIQLFTVERWLAICYPMKSHIMVGLGRSVKLLIVVWLVAITSGIPFVFYSSTIISLFDEIPANLTAIWNDNKASNLTRNVTVGDSQGVVKIPILDSIICGANDWETMWQLCVISAVVFFLVPMLIITVLYSLIAVRLRKSCKAIEMEACQPLTARTVSASSAQSLSVYSTGRRYTANSTGNKPTPCSSRRPSTDLVSFVAEKPRDKRNQPYTDRKTALRILVTVILVFFISYAPYHCQRIIGKFADRITVNMPYGEVFLDYLFYVSGILYYVSATVNPLLYNMVSKRYRRAFVYTFHEVFGCGESSESLIKSSQVISRASQFMGPRGSVCTDVKASVDDKKPSSEELNVAVKSFRSSSLQTTQLNMPSSQSGDSLSRVTNGNLPRKGQSSVARHINGRAASQTSSGKRSELLANPNIPRIVIT